MITMVPEHRMVLSLAGSCASPWVIQSLSTYWSHWSYRLRCSVDQLNANVVNPIIKRPFHSQTIGRSVDIIPNKAIPNSKPLLGMVFL